MDEAKEKTHLVNRSDTESLDITPFAVASWIEQRTRGEDPHLLDTEFKDNMEMLYSGVFPVIPPRVIRVLSGLISKAWKQADRNAIRCYIEFIGAEPWLSQSNWIKYSMTEFKQPTDSFLELVEISKPDAIRNMKENDIAIFEGDEIPIKLRPKNVPPNSIGLSEVLDIEGATNPFERFGILYEDGTDESPSLIVGMSKRTIDMTVLAATQGEKFLEVIEGVNYGTLDLDQ